MARRKKHQKPNETYPFESKSRLKELQGGGWKHRFITDEGKEETDTSTSIYYSMLTSKAYKDLSPRQRELYVIAKTQFWGARSRPSKDYPEEERLQGYQGRETFYLNHDLVTKVFGLYPRSNKRDFYNDIDALISHGFIECMSNGKASKKRSIYCYSDKWKSWPNQ